MLLADTSVWVDHLRYGNNELQQLLIEGRIVVHPFIIAELALGPLRDRAQTLALLDLLPQIRTAHVQEVRQLIESQRLYNRGIGLIDAHLIASALINPPTLLWTRDKPLRKIAEALNVHA